MKTPHIPRYLVALLLSLVMLAVLAVRPVGAQGLNPPPLIGSSCHATGSGTICQARVLRLLDGNENWQKSRSCCSGAMFGF